MDFPLYQSLKPSELPLLLERHGVVMVKLQFYFHPSIYSFLKYGIKFGATVIHLLTKSVLPLTKAFSLGSFDIALMPAKIYYFYV